MQEEKEAQERPPRKPLLDSLKKFFGTLRRTFQGFDTATGRGVEAESHNLLTYSLAPFLIDSDYTHDHLLNQSGLTEAQCKKLMSAINMLVIEEKYVSLNPRYFSKHTPTTEYCNAVRVSETEFVYFSLIVNSVSNLIVGVQILVDVDSSKKAHTYLYVYPDDIAGQGNALLSAESDSLPKVEEAIRLLMTFQSVPHLGKLKVVRNGHTLVETVTYKHEIGSAQRRFFFDLINPNDTASKIALYVSKAVVIKSRS